MTPRPRDSVKSLARRVSRPIVGRLRAQTVEAVRAELDDARATSVTEQAQMEQRIAELGAEIELLWAELEGRKGRPTD